MKIAVTGASGLLGANLVLEALQARVQVVPVTRRKDLRFPGIGAGICDLPDDVRVAADRLREVRVDWVVHAAALTDVDACQRSPDDARRVNGEWTRTLAVAAARADAGFLYISTDAVFDGARGGYRETDQTAPVNAYAASKLAGERAAEAANPRCLIVRTNLFGWNAQPKFSLAEFFLNKLRSHQPVTGYSDVIFSPLLVNDLSGLLLALIARAPPGLYHLGSSDGLSKLDFARSLAEVWSLDASLIQAGRLADGQRSAPRPLNTSLCTDRAAQALGLRFPRVVDGLRHMKALEDSGWVSALKACIGEGT
jgi:dTDP-4-dehydrorhamnose reductase